MQLKPKYELLDLIEGETVTVFLEKEQKTIPKALTPFTPSLKGNILKLTLGKTHTWNEVLTALANSKLKIKTVETQKNKLEDVFMRLTRK